MSRLTLTLYVYRQTDTHTHIRTCEDGWMDGRTDSSQMWNLVNRTHHVHQSPLGLEEDKSWDEMVSRSTMEGCQLIESSSLRTPGLQRERWGEDNFNEASCSEGSSRLRCSRVNKPDRQMGRGIDQWRQSTETHADWEAMFSWVGVHNQGYQRPWDVTGIYYQWEKTPPPATGGGAHSLNCCHIKSAPATLNYLNDILRPNTKRYTE